MKKKLCAFALVATACVGSMFMTACGDPELEKINIKADSIETTILVNSEKPNWNDLVLELIYDNDEKATVNKNEEVEILQDINMSKVGKQELKVKYKGLTASINIYVVAHDQDTYNIVGYEKPSSYVLYEGAIREATMDNDVKFAVGTHRYKVGDDNGFVFLPDITASNPDNPSEHITLTEYTSDVVVKENGEVLTGSALNDVVSIDNVHSIFDFTPEAVGRTFEITVKPLNYDETMPYDPITFTVDVVNAWNAYEVKDLARIEDNVASAHLWADKKEELGIDTTTEIEGIVLHNNLEIKRSDLPDAMFHPANTVQDGTDISGTLIDSMSFYTRDIDVNDTFSIYGNYFTISTRNTGADAVPQVKYLQHDELMAHSALFAFGGDNEYSPEDPQGRVYINSLSLFGNGPSIAEEGAGGDTGAGGLIGILTSAHNTSIENCLIRAFSSHIISDGEYNYPTADEIASVIKNTKMIDSYNSMIFAWATRNNYLENCVMKKSGGPLIVATHPDPEEDPQHFSNVHVKDCVIENMVMGTEPWFGTTGAGIIMQYLSVVSGLMKSTTENLITNGDINNLNNISAFTTSQGFFNFLTCNLGDDTVMQKEPIMSKVVVEKDGVVLNEQDMKDEFIDILAKAGVGAMPIFKAGNVYVTLDTGAFTGEENAIGMPIPGGLSLIIPAEDEEFGEGVPFAMLSFNKMLQSGTSDAGLYAANKARIDAMIAEFFNSDYVNMFYGGQCLGCTFEMFHTAPQA